MSACTFRHKGALPIRCSSGCLRRRPLSAASVYHFSLRRHSWGHQPHHTIYVCAHSRNSNFRSPYLYLQVVRSQGYFVLRSILTEAAFFCRQYLKHERLCGMLSLPELVIRRSNVSLWCRTHGAGSERHGPGLGCP